ncbi:DUF3027 domain-containing protein [Homoserinimonas sp. A520]
MPETLATPADFELARAALLDMTPASTIGEPAGSIDEGDGVVTLYFDTTMPGYKGWRWTVSIAHIEGGDPTVLETELTPGETALLSPAWVPWADRLADYKAGQAGQAAEELDDDDSDDDDDDDDDDFDDEDVNDDDEALLHSGDLDGVDIDSLDDEDDDDHDDDHEDDDDDESDDFDESAPAVDVDQADDAQDESGDAGPNPPAVGRGKQRTKK